MRSLPTVNHYLRYNLRDFIFGMGGSAGFSGSIVGCQYVAGQNGCWISQFVGGDGPQEQNNYRILSAPVTFITSQAVPIHSLGPIPITTTATLGEMTEIVIPEIPDQENVDGPGYHCDQYGVMTRAPWIRLRPGQVLFATTSGSVFVAHTIYVLEPKYNPNAPSAPPLQGGSAWESGVSWETGSDWS